MRSPTRGKGHEVKGPDRQRRVGPYGSLTKSARASAPKTRVCLPCCIMPFTYTSDITGDLKEVGISDHETCLLRNLYAGREETVRTGHGTIDWFQIVKAVYCHPAYLTYLQTTS